MDKNKEENREISTITIEEKSFRKKRGSTYPNKRDLTDGGINKHNRK